MTNSPITIKGIPPMRGLSMCIVVEAALALYSQKMWMKNRFIQHSRRFNFIQTPQKKEEELRVR
jgi:hypothetical protein